MAKATRVHILAKELGVKSKSIVEKCQAEGLDVKNHMSTISAGLAATIREWFSEGEDVTAVETADKVDLDQVRIKSPEQLAEEKAAKEKEEAAKAEAEEQAAEAKAAEEKAAAVEKAAQILEAKKKAEEEAAKAAEEAKPKFKMVEPKKIERPTAVEVDYTPPEANVPITPAGPILNTPAPAKLSGPKVVRVEAPEPVRPKRHERPARGPRPAAGVKRPVKSVPDYAAAPTEPLMPDALRGKKGGKKKGKKEHGHDDDAAKGPKRLRSKDIEERRARISAARGEILRKKPSRKIEERGSSAAAVQARPEKATIAEPITVKDLSAALRLKISDIIGKLLAQGIMANANQVIATDVAELISLDFGTELIVQRKQLLVDQIKDEFDKRERENLKPRPPVVTMLGHVDHGKTSLLDRIRSTSVATGEAGGITQHIGAYQVERNGKKITFLDTPGHAAFTAMRARGANMTDIVILVVAADDGVMPQTIEAIRHAQAAEVSIVVALNKIDIPGVDINRIYGQLAEHGLTPVQWGGDTEIIETSAHTGQGIDNILEHIETVADIYEYKADPTVPATGWVVEAKMTTTQGVVATLLIKEGRLKKGDAILAGCGYGRIRALRNCYGKNIRTADCSMPVEITGLSDVPTAGDRFYSMADEKRAKAASEEAKQAAREASLAQRNTVTLDNLFSSIAAGKVKDLNIIVKADVQGSVDVLVKYITDLSTEEVRVRVLHAAVGGVNESDVILAEASNAIIVGFNVVPEDQVKTLADGKGIDIRLYNIIYRITEDIKSAMSGLLEPEEQEKHLAKLTVRNTFKVTGVGTVAGCLVNDGLMVRKARLRLIRNNIVVKDNLEIDSLKHFKDDVREVKAGLECGIKVAGYDDIKIDDVFEAYEVVKVAREL